MDDVTGSLFSKTLRRQSDLTPALVVASSDFAVILVAITVPWAIGINTQSTIESEALRTTFFVPAGALCVTWLFMLSVMGTHAVESRFIPFQKITMATFLTFGLFAIADTIYLDSLPPSLFFWTLPLGLVLLLSSRALIQQVLLKLALAEQRTRNAVVLTTEVAVDSGVSPLDQDLGLNLASWIDVHEAMRAPSLEQYILNELARQKADTLVISTYSGLDTTQAQQLKWALENSNIRLLFMLPINGGSVGRMSLHSGMKPALVEIKNSRYTGLYFYHKRFWDILLSALGIILLSPVLLLIGIIIKLDDGGPVFFSQERVGHNRRTFRMLKFRTMCTDAEAVLPPFDGTDAGNEILFKLKNDPRITKPGRLLRQYSLDELPQLFNVLRGDMTLVGPRPPLPREVEQFEPHVLRKFLVKPGITGMWQTMGRSNLSWEDSVKLDLYYVENCNPWLDLTILARTFRAVISKEGAY